MRGKIILKKSWKSEYIQGVLAQLIVKSVVHDNIRYEAAIKVSTKEFIYRLTAANYKELLREIDLEMNNFMSAFYASQITDAIKYCCLENQDFMKEVKEYSW